MRKRTLSVLLTTTLAMSLFMGCRTNEDSNAKKDSPTVTVTTEPTTEPTVEPTVAVTTEPTAEPTVEPTDSFSTEAIEAAGAVNGVTYSNSLVGFSVSVPEAWLIYGSDETYNLLSETTNYDVDTFKSKLKEQGTTYICYGSDTQLSNGVPEYLMIQAMNINKFAGLNIEEIIKSLNAIVSNEYTEMGATCEISDPVKTVISGQDIYQVTSTAKFIVNSGDTTEQNIKSDYFIFERNNILVYMIIPTQTENSASTKTIMDSLSFQ